MQQDAVDCATQALEKYNIEKGNTNSLVSLNTNTSEFRLLQLFQILPLTSRKNLTRSTTQPGTASLAEISGHTSPMRLAISSTFTWVRWQSFFSRAAK